MHADEISGDVWTIPAARYKTKRDHVVPLIPAIAAVLPKVDRCFVFASAGFDRPFSGFSKSKEQLDQIIAELRKRAGRKPMADWVLHDLRRSARTHMAAAGVSDDVAERVLGHAQVGIAGVYKKVRLHRGESRGADAVGQVSRQRHSFVTGSRGAAGDGARGDGGAGRGEMNKAKSALG